MNHLVRRLFARKQNRTSRRLAQQRTVRQLELLERRLALAVDVAFATPQGGSGERWLTIVANDGSDAYLQMVATPTEDLIIADNASFAGRTVVEGVDARFDNIYVYNGRVVNRTLSFADDAHRFGLPVGYPGLGTAGNSLTFIMPSVGIDTTEPITGVLNLGNAAGQVVTFTNVDSDGDGEFESAFTIQSGSNVGGDLDVDFSFTSGTTATPRQLLVTVSSSLINSSVGTAAVPSLELTYDRLSAAGIPDSVVGRSGAVVNTAPTFDLFDEATHQFVPGALSGELKIDFEDLGVRLGRDRLFFQIQTTGLGIEPISFGTDLEANWGGPRSATAAINFFLYGNNVATGGVIGGGGGTTTIGGTETIQISGQFNTQTGELEFETRVDGLLRPFAISIDNVTIGLRDLTAADDADDPQGTRFDTKANDLTLFPGQTFTRGLTAELPNTGSVISIESPILATAAANGVVSLSASEVRLNSPVRANAAILIPSGDNTAFGTVTERVAVNAAVGSPSFDIRLADDPDTGNIERSQLVVSQTGSLSNLTNVLALPPAVLPVSTQAYIEVKGGDILIEGQVAATSHSYFLRSGTGSETEGPYRFTTASGMTGINTGKLTGTTVGVTLANDTFGAGFEAFQTMVSDVSLRTAVERLRIQAASRQGHSLDFPFPYDLTIEEEDDLIVDGVAASSGDMAMSAGGALDLLAAIESLGDVSLKAGTAFTVSAPVSTSFGSIDISGPSVRVNNSVRIFGGQSNRSQTDIEITATDGPLVLQDAVSAINGVKLQAFGKSGSVSGDARIIGDIIEAVSDGDISLRTEANVVLARATGSVRIDEQTSAAFEVRQSPFVTLIANGRDQVVSAGGQLATSPTLYADVFDTEKLVVSAPHGSIDVLHTGSQPLEIGDGVAIRSHGENPLAIEPDRMEAAGSVIIRSTLASEILVSDAPSATSGATEVRFATTAALPSAPDSGFVASSQPGVYPTNLTVRLPMNITDQSVPVLGGVRAADLRLGDKILVKDGLANYVDPTTGLQDPNLVNGIYVLRTVNYRNATTVELQLSRATTADTTSELSGRQYVRVTDGSTNAANSLRGRVFVSDGFVNNRPGSVNPTPLQIAAVASRTGFVTASAVTTALLPATYNAAAGTITATDNGAIGFDEELFDGVVLGVGRLVVVRSPVAGNAAAVGLYQVTAAGEQGQSRWVLSRYQGADEDGDGTRDAFFTGTVAVTQGTLRTSRTGQMFEIGYASLNRAALTYSEVTDFRAGNFLTDSFDSATQYRTDIGTNNPTGEVTYQVTSEGTTNDAAGSLGRMLTLAQKNSAKFAFEDVVEPQKFSTKIGDWVRTIELEQELPVINQPVTILADSGLVIDGSQISRNRNGGIVRSSGISSRIGPIAPSTATTARRLVRDVGVSTSLDEINGLEIGVGGAGTMISNLSIGGFRNGAAIRVAGASNVLIDDVTIGSNGNGTRLPNKYGIVVEQAAGGQGGMFTTVLNSTIVGSTVAGVSLATHADGVRLVGNTIGIAGDANSVGVFVDTGEAGLNSIGVQRVLPAGAVSGMQATARSSNSVTVAKNTVTDVFEAGIQLYDRASNRRWTVTGKTVDPTNANAYLLTLSGPLLQAGTAAGSLRVEAGYFAQVAARSQTLTLTGIDRSRLYLGQPVSSTVSGVLRTGTRITSIEARGNGETVIGISNPAVSTTTAGILFGEPRRNVIGHNVTGVVLKSGSSRIFATDVERSIFDGIRIEGVDSDGSHQIGGADGGNLSLDNVAVSANGFAGINFTEAFFASLGANPTLAAKLTLANKITIQGNFLGTNTDQAEGLSNGRDGASNIVVGRNVTTDPNADLRQELIDSTTRGVDGRYLARYRPEDNPDQRDSLRDFESLDLKGNLHFTGDPVGSSSGTGITTPTTGGVVRLPPRL